MSPHVVPYQPDHLPGCHALYSELTVGRVPHCWPVEATRLGTLLSAASAGREGARLEEQTVLVVAAADGVQGFAHVGHQAVSERVPEKQGILRFLAYRRGQRHVGDALLAGAEDWMRARGLARSVAMPQPWKYPFYAFPHAYLSDHLDHVQALLRFRGYAKSGGEVFLDWPDMQPPPATDTSGLEYELRVEEQPGAGRLPGLRLHAVQDDDGIGECVLLSGAECSADDEAHEFAFCNWLGVDAKHQGRGLGRFLLAEAMVQARERGYRHGAISTAYNNDRAFLFYTNYGFRVVDWTYEFSRELA